MANYQYVVTTPERWDNIANKAYGDPGMIEILVEANPEVPITAIIAAGTIINVPVISEDVQAADTAQLPPWLQ